MTDEPISIFQDLEEIEKDKTLFFLWRKIRAARNLTIAVGILNALIFIFTWVTSYFDIYILVVSVIFIACFFFSKKKPHPSLMTSTILYIILFPLYLYTMHFNPVDNTFRFPGAGEIIGFLIRIIIIIYLIKGVTAAKKYEALLKA